MATENVDKVKDNAKEKPRLTPVKKLNTGVYAKNGYIYKVSEGDGPNEPVARDINVNTIKEILETGNEMLELELITRENSRKSVTISRELFGNKRKLAEKLVFQGADVYEHTSQIVIKHLVNQELKARKELIHLGLGWSEDDDRGLYFKHHQGIGVNSTYEGHYDIEPRGKLQEYRELLEEEVVGRATMELALTCGFSSAVIGLIGREIEADSLAVHIYGESTIGKTTAAQLAASVWGNPSRNGDGLLRDWNATQNALIAELRNNTGVTVILDEASMSNIRDFTNTIYKLASGRDKDRLNRDAEMRETGTWYTTIVSTGEHALTTHANNNVGLLMRILEIGDITWTDSGDHADRIKHGVLNCFGTGGPEFVQYLMKMGRQDVKELWQEEQKRINSGREDVDRFQHRMAGKMAVVTTTAKLVADCLDLELNVDGILKLLIEAENRRLPDRDLAGRAYDYLMEQITISSKNFSGDFGKNIGKLESSPYGEYWGEKIHRNQSRNELIIFPSVFEEIMADGGYEEPQSILRKWKEQGILDAEKDRLTRRRKVGGSRTPVHVIALDKADDEDEAEPETDGKNYNVVKVDSLADLMKD